MATSKDEVLDFLRKHTELLEEGNFDELYFMYQQMVNLVSTSLTELLMSAGIEPLDYLTHIIGNYAPNCKLITRVVIPENIKSIGYHAFYGCTGLTSVTIPDSVTSIGSGAFKGCDSLTSITIPNSVTSIGSFAFNGCKGLTSAKILGGVTSIGYQVFYNCTGLTSVTIPNSVTYIGSDAFNGCSELTSVVIPDSVTNMGRYAFGKLTNIKYEGTKKEWYKINKDVYWNGEIQEYTVQCLDGEIKGE